MDDAGPSKGRSESLGEGLSFGEVQEKPSVAFNDLNPDLNGHCKVGIVNRGQGLPSGASAKPHTEAYVDLDAMLDMQEHAAEDTSVELGGILLGYRGESDDGTPYVVIQDSLRARHYRATRGSFTFTHETWVDLNQQRANLPESTEIVGWYHTHPGWSVFLSDMDVFICDHFFNKPDDVALVIDPTSGDTGLFVRRNVSANRPPGRLPTYKIYAHRKRAEYVDQWVAYFSGVSSMSNPSAVFPGRSSSPVVVHSTSDGASNRLLILLAIGLIGCQLLIGLGMFAAMQRSGVAAEMTPPSSDIAVREQVVDELIEKLALGGPASIDQDYRETAVRNAELRASNLGLMSRIENLNTELKSSLGRSQRAMLEIESLSKKLAGNEETIAALKIETDGSPESLSAWWRPEWYSAAAGMLAGILIASAGALVIFRQSLVRKETVNSLDTES